MSLRAEFVLLATKENSNISAICKQFGISRKTGYKWLKKYQEGGLSFLTDQPRTRLAQPTKTNDIITNKIIDLRDSHPSWGARKLKRRLEDLGEISIPSTTTVGNILKRHNKISELSSTQAKAFIRFEHPEPNDLWQMDFKGWFNTDKSRCYPLTVLDDHSRYSITLKECLNERTEGVKSALITAFRTYGLPKRMTMDNGAPWAGSNNKQITKLKAWLIRIGIKVSHSRPYHPQTQGKDERFHRTLKVELLNHNRYADLIEVGKAFEQWRFIYNTQRPHEALNLATPISRYINSPRLYPENLPPIEYDYDDVVRKVNVDGKLSIKGKVWIIGRSLEGQLVALRKTQQEDIIDVFYCHQKIKTIDLRG